MRQQLVLLLAGLAGISGLSGCSRQFWRKQADRDSYSAIAEKLNDKHWVVPRFDLEPDPRSRFYEPHDPDKIPLPPDDPTAHEVMHTVSGRKGYNGWHKLGVSFALENPQWLAPYGIEVNGVDPVSAHSKVELLNVTIPQALDLATIHSREYQNNIETLYLSALELTAERFRLGVRYLDTGRSEPGVGLTGGSNAAGDGSMGLKTAFGLSQALPTGGQIAVDIANSVTWAFAGDGRQTSAPSLGYSLTQPLLFQAGRKIALENLTQAERSVLYDVRTLARFRQTLFTQITSAYLQLMQQQQAILNTQNNIRQLEEQLEAQEVRDTRVPGVVNAALDGFQGLQIPPDLENQLSYDGNWLRWRGNLADDQETKILALSDDPDYLAAAAELIDFKKQQTTSLSYLQLRDRLNRSLATLANNRRQLDDSRDTFKINLGLPTNVRLEVDLELLKPFELISWDLINLENDIRSLQKNLGKALLPADPAADGALQGPALKAVKDYVTALSNARDKLQVVGIETVRRDFDPLNQLLERTKDDFAIAEFGLRYFRSAEERSELEQRIVKDGRLFRLAEREFSFGSSLLNMLTDLLNHESEEQLLKSLDKDASGRIDLAELPEQWRELPRSGDRDAAESYSIPELLTEAASGARDLRDKYLLRMAQSLEVIQASLRVEQIAIVPFSLDGTMRIPDIEEVVALGLEYRHDLMNARAAVMDARRDIEIRANQLEAGLDVTFRGKQGLNPDAEGSTSHSAGLQFTTPLDQVLERNNYRQSLVNFQRTRRTYMEQEDRVKQTIRQSWRQLQVQEYRLLIDRTAVRNAALQYDSASLQAQGSQQTNALSLVNALDAVLQAQNSLIGDWVTYETNRLNIFRDMGIMDIDPRGVWTDRFYLQQFSANPPDTVTPPATAPDAVPPAPAAQETAPPPQNPQ
jgi:outer membrane protein TolC